MSTCWFCHWGWPKPINDIYEDCADRLEALGEDSESLLCYGPGHIVWADENFDQAQWCLDHFDEYSGPDDSPEALAVVRESLERLLKVPDEFKVWPEDYDGTNPEECPPPEHWEMVKQEF